MKHGGFLGSWVRSRGPIAPVHVRVMSEREYPADTAHVTPLSPEWFREATQTRG